MLILNNKIIEDKIVNIDQTNKVKNGLKFNVLTTETLMKLIGLANYYFLKSEPELELVVGDAIKVRKKKFKFKADHCFYLVSYKLKIVKIFYTDGTISIRNDRINSKAREVKLIKRILENLQNKFKLEHPEFSDFNILVESGVLFPDVVADTMKKADKEDLKISEVTREVNNYRSIYSEDGLDFATRLSELVKVIIYISEHPEEIMTKFSELWVKLFTEYSHRLECFLTVDSMKEDSEFFVYCLTNRLKEYTKDELLRFCEELGIEISASKSKPFIVEKIIEWGKEQGYIK